MSNGTSAQGPMVVVDEYHLPQLLNEADLNIEEWEKLLNDRLQYNTQYNLPTANIKAHLAAAKLAVKTYNNRLNGVVENIRTAETIRLTQITNLQAELDLLKLNGLEEALETLREQFFAQAEKAGFACTRPGLDGVTDAINRNVEQRLSDVPPPDSTDIPKPMEMPEAFEGTPPTPPKRKGKIHPLIPIIIIGTLVGIGLASAMGLVQLNQITQGEISPVILSLIILVIIVGWLTVWQTGEAIVRSVEEKLYAKSTDNPSWRTNSIGEGGILAVCAAEFGLEGYGFYQIGVQQAAIYSVWANQKIEPAWAIIFFFFGFVCSIPYFLMKYWTTSREIKERIQYEAELAIYEEKLRAHRMRMEEIAAEARLKELDMAEKIAKLKIELEAKRMERMQAAKISLIDTLFQTEPEIRELLNVAAKYDQAAKELQDAKTAAEPLRQRIHELQVPLTISPEDINELRELDDVPFREIEAAKRILTAP